MINWLRKITPHFVFRIYHYILAVVASFVYRRPSGGMIVIGVTGTNGKSSTVNIIGKLLESEKTKVGWITTANFKISDKEWLNDTKMTMLGRFKTQKMLRKMKDAGCTYAIIEVSSQGIEQYRHIGINYDYLVFTNLTPEHIEAHGGFENYKKAKGKLFKRLSRTRKKSIKGRDIRKMIIANLDDENVDYFLDNVADWKVGYTLEDEHDSQLDIIYTVKDVEIKNEGLMFEFEGTKFHSSLVGKFNVYNMSAALSIVFEEGVPLEQVQGRVDRIKGIPGRMELIDEGQDFQVLIDYAPEPQSLLALYDTLSLFTYNRLIHVLGSCGGGRDVARRPVMGEMAAKKADIIIVTNEDPYDDDPMEIIFNVADGAKKAGKKVGDDLLIIEDRKEAIRKAISMAKKGDMVLITGKGCELFIVGKNLSKEVHDDREEARQAIKKTFPDV